MLRYRGQYAPEQGGQYAPESTRRTIEIEQLVPVLYLHGVSTGRMLEVLKSIAGDRFDSMSPATVTRIIESWQHEHDQWSKRRITKRYVYMWADGIYTKVRTTDHRPCMLVLIGCDEHGNKDLLAIYDGEQESELSWTAALTDLKNRGLQAPRLAVGDGALGFWGAINKVYPKTAHQGCTVHATRNVLDKLPKKLFDEVKPMVQDIFLAPTLKDAKDAINVFAASVRPKYPKAVEMLERRLDMLFSYYSFPAEHWKSIRSTSSSNQHLPRYDGGLRKPTAMPRVRQLLPWSLPWACKPRKRGGELMDLISFCMLSMVRHASTEI